MRFLTVLLVAFLAAGVDGGVWADQPPYWDGQLERRDGDEPIIQTGLGSWYGPGFHGNLTANGEIFDQTKLTAAHKTLPLPSIVRVTNLDTAQSLILRVNDRGPYIKGRIIDVSHEAAKILGFEEKGIAKVMIEVLGAEAKLDLDSE